MNDNAKPAPGIFRLAGQYWRGILTPPSRLFDHGAEAERQHLKQMASAVFLLLAVAFFFLLPQWSQYRRLTSVRQLPVQHNLFSPQLLVRHSLPSHLSPAKRAQADLLARGIPWPWIGASGIILWMGCRRRPSPQLARDCVLTDLPPLTLLGMSHRPALALSLGTFAGILIVNGELISLYYDYPLRTLDPSGKDRAAWWLSFLTLLPVLWLGLLIPTWLASAQRMNSGQSEPSGTAVGYLPLLAKLWIGVILFAQVTFPLEVVAQPWKMVYLLPLIPAHLLWLAMADRWVRQG